MNRYRGSTIGAPSKASASTQCQKCLKRGHYSYECKAVAQDRPYVSRPSRTQQLFNPKLVPELTSDVPQDLLRKKGIADEQLAKKEQERGRKRDRQDDVTGTYNKRLRSSSSASSRSVSTISTDRSPSPVPQTSRHRSSSLADKKRRRDSVSSAGSHVNGDEHRGRERHDSTDSRNTRRRYNDASPRSRGRRRSRELSYDQSSRYSSAESTKRSHDDGVGGRQQYRDDEENQSEIENPREHARAADKRRRYSRSPESKHRNDKRVSRRTREDSLETGGAGRKRLSRDDDRYGTTFRKGTDTPNDSLHARGGQARAPPRERSLSPFSKRLALTQAMNMR